MSDSNDKAEPKSRSARGNVDTPSNAPQASANAPLKVSEPRDKASRPTLDAIIGLEVSVIAAGFGSLVGNIPLILIPTVVATAFTLILRTRVEYGSPNRLIPNREYARTTLIVTLAVFSTAVFVWHKAVTSPSTLYFVVDTTRQAKPHWNAVYQELNAVIQSQPGAVRIGLRTYGGLGKSGPLCPDTSQVLPVSGQAAASVELERLLGRLQPGGHGSLTAAVLDAVESDLVNFHDPVKLFVITSKLDTFCDPPFGGILDSQALRIRRRRNNLDLLIATVGHIDPRSDRVLRRYAAEFHGCYLNTSITNLPRIIHTVSSYGSGYLVTHENQTSGTSCP